MSMPSFRLPAAVACVLLLAACGPSRGPAGQHSVTRADDGNAMVMSIRAAGRQDKSAIQVAPLRDPAVQQLTDSAYADEAAGRYREAAAQIDQALKLTPKSPDLLQYRAELAVRLHDYKQAVHLAEQSYELGPRLGSLCARNWQTIVEVRKLGGDPGAVASARTQRDKCHVDGPVRM